jgi:hypothetical protein
MSFHNKVLKKLGIERSYLNITKAIYDGPLVNLIKKNGEKLKILSLKLGMSKGSTLSTLTQDSFLFLSQRCKAR